MNYYALFTCDEWKSYASMSLLGVFTKTKLIVMLRSDRFELSESVIKTMGIRQLNNATTYGYIEELSINEVL